MVRSQGNCVVMNHGNPLKSAGMWASRACEMESNGYICQRQQGTVLISAHPRWARKVPNCDIFVFSCRFGSASGSTAYPCFPVQTCGTGSNDLPRCGEATGLDWRPAPLRIFERDPGPGEKPPRAGVPHTADQQPPSTGLDRSLQLRGELANPHYNPNMRKWIV